MGTGPQPCDPAHSDTRYGGVDMNQAQHTNQSPPHSQHGQGDHQHGALLGYSPVYAPHTPPPTAPRQGFDLGQGFNIYAIVAFMFVGLVFGWALADAQLGGADVRAFQREVTNAEQERAMAEQRAIELEALLQDLREVLRCRP